MPKHPVLVTGGAGYVGRELVSQLIADNGSEVHLLDNLTSGEHRLDGLERSRFVLHRADIRDREAVKRIMRAVEPRIVFHLAAMHYIPACEAAPGDAVSINVSGTVNLLHAAPAGAIFVLASTAAVYAPSFEAHFEDDIGSGPIDIYGLTKLHSESFVRYFDARNAVRGMIVRLFNVVGPGETNPHLVPAIIEQLSSGKTKLKLGNLFPHRDYIDVSDAAAGFRALATCRASEETLTVCNLGTGQSHKVSDVVQLISKASGVDITIVQDQERVRAVDRPMLKASTDKLQRLTNWLPQVDLEGSMRRAWASRAEDRLK